MGEQHTPGPWLLTERQGYYEILAKADNCDWYGNPNMHAVAYADTEIEEVEQRANARLIAAAPDLLEALMALVKNSDDLEAAGHTRVAKLDRLYTQAVAAIAKAKGTPA